MKLLIADDEKIVQDSIQLIIQRENLQDIEIETAFSGGEAIEKVMQFHPDVIFMDIDMPGIDGMEATRSIRNISPDVIIAIITAYDVFQYVQSSIHYGVFEYLLKPFTPAKIISLLERARKKLKSDYALQKKVIQMREQIATTQKLVNNGILHMMIGRTGMTELLEQAGMPLIEQAGRIAILAAETEEQQAFLEKQVRMCAPLFNGVIFGAFARRKAIIFVPQSADFAEFCRRLLGESPPSGICIASGNLQNGLENLWISYHQAAEAMYTCSKAIRIYSESSHILENRIDLYRKMAEDCFTQNPVEWAVEQVMEQITASGDLQQSALQATHIAMLMAELLYKQGPANSKYSQEFRYSFFEVMAASNMVELHSTFERLVLQIRRYADQTTEDVSNEYVRRALEYIDANLEKELSLGSVAQQLNLSPGFLGRLFRTNLNKGFIEVLTNKRVQKAIDLIQAGEYSMKEICYMVGYNDPNYFSRAFKRVTGEKPSAYKKRGSVCETH